MRPKPGANAHHLKMKILGIIPARYASTGFRQTIHPIAGKSLIQRVVEQCQKAKSLSEVIMATDDARIAEVAKNSAGWK